MAEREGFEPSVRVKPVRRFSKPLVSATHPSLLWSLRCRFVGHLSMNLFLGMFGLFLGLAAVFIAFF